jgi:sugar O-acyltransferase (sialic acid O-acetyltransferase NeuD family)
MSLLIGIYGASGAGRGVLPLAREQRYDCDNVRLVFIDDFTNSKQLNGHEVLRFEEFMAQPETDKRASIAVADPQMRAVLSQKCTDNRVVLQSIRSSNIVIMDDVKIGEGAIISPFVCFTSNIRVGRMFHANIGSIIEHDCEIGDYVTFAPGVRCNGAVSIGDFAYIGAGVTIKQGSKDKPLHIGARAVVGMGAVVTKDVPAGATVVGNPARIMER